MPDKNSNALVLAGGGVAGIAWELGVLLGLQDSGVDVTGADLVVGTSAGSSVGAQITSGAPLADLYARQLLPPEQSGEIKRDFDPAKFQQAALDVMKTGPRDLQDMRARFGAMALAAPTVSEAERRAVIAGRLPVHDWPQRPLLITTIATDNGEFVVLDRNSGVPLVDAVAASCAVPLVWPPVTINGRRYMDGGMSSPANATLAAGHGRVLILVPAAPMVENPYFRSTDSEQAELEAGGSKALIIYADAASLAAIGTNPLDPATREPTAKAGRAQGHEWAAKVAEFWNGE